VICDGGAFKSIGVHFEPLDCGRRRSGCEIRATPPLRISIERNKDNGLRKKSQIMVDKAQFSGGNSTVPAAARVQSVR
jgi:hypothetical protein